MTQITLTDSDLSVTSSDASKVVAPWYALATGNPERMMMLANLAVLLDMGDYQRAGDLSFLLGLNLGFSPSRALPPVWEIPVYQGVTS